MGNILGGILFPKECPELTKVFQFFLVTAWDQSNCLPLSVLADSLCHGHSSLAVHFLIARSTSALPSPLLQPGRKARAVATAIAVATAGELLLSPQTSPSLQQASSEPLASPCSL